MNVALRNTMTLPEFLAWEERQELRYEFDGFRPIAMVGGTAAHSLIQTRLLTALTNHLDGKRCVAHGSHMKVLVAGRIRYPEASVVCSEVTPDAQYLTDPVVIFEVLSDGTANDDLVVKNAEYRDTPSIQRYVVLQQTHVSATVFCRHGDFWVADTATGEDAVLHMPEIEISIPLSEIYKGVRLRGAEEPGPAN